MNQKQGQIGLKTTYVVLVVFLGIGFCSLISGCGNLSRGWARLVGHSEVCVDNVVYLQFPSGVTVKYLPNGQIAGCL